MFVLYSLFVCTELCSKTWVLGAHKTCKVHNSLPLDFIFVLVYDFVVLLLLVTFCVIFDLLILYICIYLTIFFSFFVLFFLFVWFSFFIFPFWNFSLLYFSVVIIFYLALSAWIYLPGFVFLDLCTWICLWSTCLLYNV